MKRDVNVTVDVDDKSLEKTLQKLERKLKAGAEEGLEDTIEQGRDSAKSKLEQERRAYNSPHLRNSFLTRINDSGDELVGRVINSQEYASYVDKGVSGTERKRDTPHSYTDSKPPLDKMIEYVEARMSDWDITYDYDLPYNDDDIDNDKDNDGDDEDDGDGGDSGSSDYYNDLDDYQNTYNYTVERIEDTKDLEKGVVIRVDTGGGIIKRKIDSIDDDGGLNFANRDDSFNIDDDSFDIIGRNKEDSFFELEVGNEVTVNNLAVRSIPKETTYGELVDRIIVERDGEEYIEFEFEPYNSNFDSYRIGLEQFENTRQNDDDWFDEFPEEQRVNIIEGVPDEYSEIEFTKENITFSAEKDEDIVFKKNGNLYRGSVDTEDEAIEAGINEEGDQVRVDLSLNENSFTVTNDAELVAVREKQDIWLNLEEGDDIISNAGTANETTVLTDQLDFDRDDDYVSIYTRSEDEAYIRGSYIENTDDEPFIDVFRDSKAFDIELDYEGFLGRRDNNEAKWAIKNRDIGDKVTGFREGFDSRTEYTGYIVDIDRERTSHMGRVKIVTEDGEGKWINDKDIISTEAIEKQIEPPANPDLPENYEPYEKDVLDEFEGGERFYAWLHTEKRFAKVENNNRNTFGTQLVNKENSPLYSETSRERAKPFTHTIVGKKTYYNDINEYEEIDGYENTRIDDADALQGVDSLYFDNGDETIQAEIIDRNSALQEVTVAHDGTETVINLSAFENQIFRISNNELDPSDIERNYYKDIDKYFGGTIGAPLKESAGTSDINYRAKRIESTDDVFEGLRIVVDYGDNGGIKYGNVTEIDKEKHIIKIDAGVAGTYINLADPEEKGQIIGRDDKVYIEELEDGQEIYANAEGDDMFGIETNGKYREAEDGTPQLELANGERRRIKSVPFTKESDPERWEEEVTSEEEDFDYYKNLEEYEISDEFKRERIESTDDVVEGITVQYDTGDNTFTAEVMRVNNDNTLTVRYSGSRTTHIDLDNGEYQIFARQAKKYFAELNEDDEIEFTIDGNTDYGEIVDIFYSDIAVRSYTDGERYRVNGDTYKTTREESDSWFSEVDESVRATTIEPDSNGSYNGYSNIPESLDVDTIKRRASETDENILVEANGKKYVASVGEPERDVFKIEVGRTPDGEYLSDEDVTVTHFSEKQQEFVELEDGDDVLLNIADSSLSRYEIRDEYNFAGNEGYYREDFADVPNQAFVRATLEQKEFGSEDYVYGIPNTNKTISQEYAAYIGKREDNNAAWEAKNLQQGDIVKTENGEGRVTLSSRERKYHGGSITFYDTQEQETKYVTDFDVIEYTKDSEWREKKEKPPDTKLPPEYEEYKPSPNDIYANGDKYYAYLEGEDEFAEVEHNSGKWFLTAEDRDNRRPYDDTIGTYTLTLVGKEKTELSSDFNYDEDLNNGNSIIEDNRGADDDEFIDSKKALVKEEYNTAVYEPIENPEEFDYEVNQQVVYKDKISGEYRTDYVEFISDDDRLIEFGSDSIYDRFLYRNDKDASDVEPIAVKNVKKNLEFESGDEVIVDNSKIDTSLINRVERSDEKEFYKVDKVKDGTVYLYSPTKRKPAKESAQASSLKIRPQQDEDKIFADKENQPFYWEIVKEQTDLTGASVTIQKSSFSGGIIEGYAFQYGGIEEDYLLKGSQGPLDTNRLRYEKRKKERFNVEDIVDINLNDTEDTFTVPDTPKRDFEQDVEKLDTTGIENLEVNDRVIIFDKIDKEFKSGKVQSTDNRADVIFILADDNEEIDDRHTHPIKGGNRNYRTVQLPAEIVAKHKERKSIEEGGAVIDGNSQIWYGQKVEYEDTTNGNRDTGIIRDWDTDTIYLNDDTELSRVPTVEHTKEVRELEDWDTLPEEEQRKQLEAEFRYRVPKIINSDSSIDGVSEFISEFVYDKYKNEEYLNNILKNMAKFKDKTTGGTLGAIAPSTGDTESEFAFRLGITSSGLTDAKRSTAMHEFTHAMVGTSEQIDTGSTTYSQAAVDTTSNKIDFPTEYAYVPFLNDGTVDDTKWRDLERQMENQRQRSSSRDTYLPGTRLNTPYQRETVDEVLYQDEDNNPLVQEDEDEIMDIDVEVNSISFTGEELKSLEYDDSVDEAEVVDNLEAGDVVKIRSSTNVTKRNVFTGRKRDIGGTVKYGFVNERGSTDIRINNGELGGYDFLGVAKDEYKSDGYIDKPDFEPQDNPDIKQWAETVNRVAREQFITYQKEYEQQSDDSLGIASDRIAVARPYASAGAEELGTKITEAVVGVNPEASDALPKIYEVHPELVEQTLDMFNPSDDVEDIIRREIPELEDKL